ncbi:tyrosine-type recombinase/integrase [Microbacterium sp. gxy059]|uniref:tyrosine-type recombinase/integrase n=1 Tax=Microbacterium sp. gxy059 TaxID=2957199 RepID=UPI003D96435F
MAALKPAEHYLDAWLAVYTGSTLRAYRSYLRAWQARCYLAGIHILEATTEMLEEWIRSERARGMRDAGIRASLGAILRFYRWAYARGHIPVDIAQGVRRPPRPGRSAQARIPRTSAACFLDAARDFHPGIHVAACLHLLNGLRLAESLRARTEHLLPDDGALLLTLPLRKKRHSGRVSLPARTREAIDALPWRGSPGPIIRYGSTPIPADRLYTAYDKVSDAAGLDINIRPHMLRAAFITLSLDAGVPIRDVMYSAGVASFDQVSYYDRAYGEIARNASIPLAAWLEAHRDR